MPPWSLEYAVIGHLTARVGSSFGLMAVPSTPAN
jgi:hypothetical protein